LRCILPEICRQRKQQEGYIERPDERTMALMRANTRHQSSEEHCELQNTTQALFGEAIRLERCCSLLDLSDYDFEVLIVLPGELVAGS
jgi:hypothetical protein